jgi:hypothetical protein
MRERAVIWQLGSDQVGKLVIRQKTRRDDHGSGIHATFCLK